MLLPNLYFLLVFQLKLIVFSFERTRDFFSVNSCAFINCAVANDGMVSRSIAHPVVVFDISPRNSKSAGVAASDDGHQDPDEIRRKSERLNRQTNAEGQTTMISPLGGAKTSRREGKSSFTNSWTVATRIRCSKALSFNFVSFVMKVTLYGESRSFSVYHKTALMDNRR